MTGSSLRNAPAQFLDADAAFRSGAAAALHARAMPEAGFNLWVSAGPFGVLMMRILRFAVWVWVPCFLKVVF